MVVIRSWLSQLLLEHVLVSPSENSELREGEVFKHPLALAFVSSQQIIHFIIIIITLYIKVIKLILKR